MLTRATEYVFGFFIANNDAVYSVLIHKMINSHRMLPSVCTWPTGDNRQAGRESIHRCGQWTHANRVVLSHSSSPTPGMQRSCQIRCCCYASLVRR